MADFFMQEASLSPWILIYTSDIDLLKLFLSILSILDLRFFFRGFINENLPYGVYFKMLIKIFQNGVLLKFNISKLRYVTGYFQLHRSLDHYSSTKWQFTYCQF